VLAAAVAIASLGPATAVSLAAPAPVSLQCAGAAGDVAGAVGGAPKSSKELVELLGTMTKSDGLPPLPATVDSNAPVRVKANSGDVSVSFQYNIVLDDATRGFLKDTLHLSTVKVRDTVATIDYSGAVSGSFQGTVASQTMDLAGAGSATVSMAGKIPTTSPGRIQFKGGSVNFAIDINGSVAGVANIGTLTLTCQAQGTVASTTVQIPGAPIVPDVIDGPSVSGGQVAAVQIIGRPDIQPDSGNPIVPASLRIVNGAPGAKIVDGALVQPTDPSGGVYTSDLEICAAPRAMAAIPGIDEVQTLKWGGTYVPGPGLEGINAHPLGMKLSFGGQETAEIPLTTADGGNETLGHFVPPSATAVESALAALPNVGSGNVRVARNTDGSYAITFTGALGGRDQPAVTISGWRTHLDYATYEQIQELIGKLTAPKPPAGESGGSGEPDPGATDLKLDQLWEQFIGGSIGWDQFSVKFGQALVNSIIAAVPVADLLDLLKQLFPQKPTIVITRIGEPGVSGSPATPLCASFTVRVLAAPAPQIGSSSGCLVTKTSVPVKVWVRRTNRGRVTRKRVKVIGLRTTRSGPKCPRTFRYDKRRRLTLTRMLPTLVPQTAKPRRARLRVTAKGVRKAYVRNLRVKKTADGYTISGRITLPKRYKKVRSIRLTVAGGGMQTSTRTVRRS